DGLSRRTAIQSHTPQTHLLLKPICSSNPFTPQTHLLLAWPFVAHGCERNQPEILRGGFRIGRHEAAHCLHHLPWRPAGGLAEFEIVRKYTAHEDQGRENSHAAFAAGIGCG